jgi:hypothetical protein
MPYPGMHPWEQAALLGFAGTPQLPRDSEKQEAKETEPEAHNIEIPDPRAAFAKALRVHLEDTKSYQRHAATDSNHARNIFDSIKKDKAVHTIAQISSETLIDLLLAAYVETHLQEACEAKRTEQGWQ